MLIVTKSNPAWGSRTSDGQEPPHSGLVIFYSLFNLKCQPSSCNAVCRRKQWTHNCCKMSGSWEEKFCLMVGSLAANMSLNLGLMGKTWLSPPQPSSDIMLGFPKIHVVDMSVLNVSSVGKATVIYAPDKKMSKGGHSLSCAFCLMLLKKKS